MIIKFIDPIYCQVIPKEEIQKIKSCLEYPTEFWKQGPFRKVKKEGTAFLCDQRKGTFLAGLYLRVWKYCQINGIKVDTPEPFLFSPPTAPNLPGIDLREDQLVLINKANEFKRGLIVGPPGIGKTVLAGSIISQFQQSISVIVVHTDALFKQTIEEFTKWFGEKSVGIIGAGIYNPNRINVVMSQTAMSICSPNDNYKSFLNLLMETDVLIIDEAHHSGNQKGSYSCIFERCLAPIRIGLTATPVTKKRETLVCEGFLGPIIGQLSVQEGIEKGLLAIPKVKLIPVPTNSTISSHPRYQDLYKHGIILNKARNRLIVREAADRVSKGESVLIMIIDVVNEQGQIIQKMGKDIYNLDIALVQGPTESETREKIKKELKSKEIKCVISTSVWREGINIPSLDCVIWASGGKSDISTLQAIGRGLRTTDEKKNFTIIDFLDPYHYLAQHTIERIKVYIENGCM